MEEVPLTPRGRGFHARSFAFQPTDTESLAPRRKWVAVAVGTALVLLVVAAAATVGFVLGTRHKQPPANLHGGPNVVVMVGDGLGPQMTSLARLFAAHAQLHDPLAGVQRAGCRLGLVATASASHHITDSAAAATALSCGRKTTNGFVGVTPDGVPCGTVLEAAALAGMATGIAVTSTVSHATPAAFTAHAASRSDEQGIALEQLQQFADGRLHVAVGGGRDHWTAAKRADGADLLAAARALGVDVVLNRSALDAAVASDSTAPLLALLAPGRLAYEIDIDDFRADVFASDSDGSSGGGNGARAASERPSTADIATAAWRALQKITAGERPFFLLVEGSLIDFAEHSNDASTAIWETLGFFRAVSAILHLAQKDGNTIVLVTSDHDTGGLSISGGNIAFDLISAANASIETLADMIHAGENTTSVLERYTAIHDLTADEIAKIDAAAKHNVSALQDTIAQTLADRIGISWGTDGHTATNVLLYSCLDSWANSDDDDDDDNDEDVAILWDNTDVAKWIATQLGLDLAAATNDTIRRFNITSIFAHTQTCLEHPQHCL